MTKNPIQSQSPGENRQKERLLKAAAEVFLERGYSDASVDEMASRIKASKVTLYKHFGNKEALFEAVVRHQIGLIHKQLSTAFQKQTELKLWLEDFANLLMVILLAEENVAFLRMLHAEASRFPNLVNLYEREGPRVTLGWLAEYLAGQMQEGLVRSAAPQLAAEHFFHLTLGEIGRQRLLNVRPRLSRKEAAERLKDGVDVFWRAYATNTVAPLVKKSESAFRDTCSKNLSRT